MERKTRQQKSDEFISIELHMLRQKVSFRFQLKKKYRAITYVIMLQRILLLMAAQYKPPLFLALAATMVPGNTPDNFFTY